MVEFGEKHAFETALRTSFPAGFDLDDRLWRYIRWLERQEQVFKTRNTQDLFVPTTPVANVDALWSHLAFVIEPDLISHWFGRRGLESRLVPLVKCGADGCHLAVWKEGGQDRYVFLGSEGEAFQVTTDVRCFIMLITMGYFSIEDKRTFSLRPEENFVEYNSQPWPEPVLAQDRVRDTLGLSYPKRGSEILDIGEGAFEQFVTRQSR